MCDERELVCVFVMNECVCVCRVYALTLSLSQSSLFFG